MAPQIRRVLLINPFCVEGQYNPGLIRSGGQLTEDPIGLRYLTSYLREKVEAIDVEIYDAHLEAVEHIKATNVCDMDVLWRMLKDEIVAFQPDLVGVSCLFHFSSPMAHQTCSLVKSVSKKIVTVMGGCYPTVSFLEALKDPNLDYAVFSEGEAALADLITALNNGEHPQSCVDGFAFRDEDDGITSVPKKTFVDLDSLPWSERCNSSAYTERSRHYAMRTLDPEDTRIATMVGSRGCPYSCTFCNTTIFWGNRIRHRSVDDIVAEMKYLVEEHRMNTFIFNDDNISINRKFILSLCNAIVRSGIGIHWLSGSGLQVSSLTEEVVAAMHESGFSIFNLGIESGNENTLKRIRKPLRLDQVPRAIERIRKCYRDGYVIGMLIVGFPFETKADIEDTIEFASDLDLDWISFSNFQPYPGTIDYDFCMEKGYIGEKGIKHSDLSKASRFSTEHFTYDYIEDEGYLSNLKLNFVNNRNLRKGKLDRAVRDFQYVLNIQPDHAVAHFVLGQAYTMLNENDKAAESRRIAGEIVASDERWKNYFERLHLSV